MFSFVSPVRAKRHIADGQYAQAYSRAIQPNHEQAILGRPAETSMWWLRHLFS